jgi:hypothetical protein
MTSFNFFKKIGHQTVFIGRWDIKFIFFQIFFNSISQKMTKFVFKQLNSYLIGYI